GAGDAGHHRLTPEFAVGADLAGHARHFGGEPAQLLDHRVDRFLELQDFAPDVDRDLFREVAVGDGDRHLRDVAYLSRQITGHLIDRLGELLPDAGHPLDLRLASELALRADFARHARHFRRE